MKNIVFVVTILALAGFGLLGTHSGAGAGECILASDVIITVRPEPLKVESTIAEIAKRPFFQERIVKVEKIKDSPVKKTRYTLSEKL